MSLMGGGSWHLSYSEKERKKERGQMEKIMLMKVTSSFWQLMFLCSHQTSCVYDPYSDTVGLHPSFALVFKLTSLKCISNL
jgi:hypothetical protein